MNMHPNITLSNLKDLDSFDEVALKKSIESWYRKLARLTHNESELKIHFKDYQKEGSRQKHVVHASFHCPGITVRDEEWDWDLHKATHRVLKKLLRNLEKKLEKTR